MSDKKILVQNEGFLYNQNIQEGIRKMSYSTNVLERYDNVVYNARLFMFPRDIEREIENLEYNAIKESNHINFGEKFNNKIIIAQTGVSARFSINQILLSTTFGGMGAITDVTSYAMKITLKEQRSCMFVNELELVSRLVGYDAYMHRPYWLEIWFSGYDPETLMPIERIPLSNDDDRLIYRGFMGSVKSELEGNSTTWILDFYPDQNVFINKHNNILAISPEIKRETSITMQEYLENEGENAKKRDIERFPNEADRKKVEKLYEENKFIEFIIKDGDNNLADIGKSIHLDKNYNRDIDKDGTLEKKSDEKIMQFTDMPQWFLARSINHKNCIARVTSYSKSIGTVNNKEIYSTQFVIVISKSNLMTKDVNNVDFSNNHKITPEEATTLFSKCVGKGTLIKKYNFGFSGRDTSVLEVMNNYDRLWYMNAIRYAVSRQNEANENLINSQVSNITNEQTSSFSRIKDTTAPENPNKSQDYLGLLENVYESVKNSSDISALIKLNYPVLSNDLDAPMSTSTSQSTDPRKDAQTLASINAYNKLYHSGQMSTTKFKIIGDPYWLIPICKNNYYRNNTKNFIDEIHSPYPSSEEYRCVFGVKSFLDENNDGYDKNVSDYSFEYSLNVTGIYKIYKCDTELSEEKFIQTLYGTLDFDLIDDDAISEISR